MQFTEGNDPELISNDIYVFASNLAGLHVVGTAMIALSKYDAKIGDGDGFTGKCYAVPVKDKHIKLLSLNIVNNNINKLYNNIKSTKSKRFIITEIAIGFSFYKVWQIAPLFIKYVDLDTFQYTVPNLTLPKSIYDYIILNRYSILKQNH